MKPRQVGCLVLLVVAVVAVVWVVVGALTYQPSPDDRFIDAVQAKVGNGDGVDVAGNRDRLVDAGHRICSGADGDVVALELVQAGASPAVANATRDSAREVLCPGGGS